MDDDFAISFRSPGAASVCLGDDDAGGASSRDQPIFRDEDQHGRHTDRGEKLRHEVLPMGQPGCDGLLLSSKCGDLAPPICPK